MDDPLSLQRLLSARETLHAITQGLRDGIDFRGAVGGVDLPDPPDNDVLSLFVEARRNLCAFAHWKHGEDGLEAMLDGDATFYDRA